VSDASQALVLVLGIKLQDVVADQVVLDELSKLLLVAGGGGDDKLRGGRGTLAVEVLTLGSASDFSMSENSLRVSSLTLSHSSKMTHFSSERSYLLLTVRFCCIFFARPIRMCPFSVKVL
jgi:hypothetical protein